MVITVLDSGEEVYVTDTVEVEICEDTIFTNMTDLILGEPLNGIPFMYTS